MSGKLIFGDPASRNAAEADAAARRKVVAAKRTLDARRKAGFPCASPCAEHGRMPWDHEWHEHCALRQLWVPALKQHSAEALREAMLEILAEAK